ncbi:hypothetical protein O181_006487 [Austropuccinia psidii MF-1]|uniref:Uncharacterized protein n=1 Tax=Austropuccinia psidii MF-1 TaxID=1389203 RepID=A0A9Q3BKW5_9BASI|nr:hypothetical protein [Austropuccinia psidii MF-1]
MRVWMFVSHMELGTCSHELFVQVGLRRLHLHILLPSCAPSPTTAQAPTQAPAPATSGSTCVTHRWSMLPGIRPSCALPLCECVTPMHPLHCVAGSNQVTCSS